MGIKPIRGSRLDITHRLSRGMVGCWIFNEGTGGKAFDLSENRNHGDFGAGTAAPTWVPGRTGTALDFDGGDYIDCGNGASLNISNAITVGVWVKRSATGGWQAILTKKTTSAGNYRNYELCFCGAGLNALEDSIAFFFYTGSAFVGHSSDIAYTDTDWHHYSAVHTFGDGTTTKLFRDGIEISGAWDDGVGNETPVTGNYPLYLGVVDPTIGEHFNGTIDEVRICNRGLSATEIAWLYRENYEMFL